MTIPRRMVLHLLPKRCDVVDAPSQEFVKEGVDIVFVDNRNHQMGHKHLYLERVLCTPKGTCAPKLYKKTVNEAL